MAVTPFGRLRSAGRRVVEDVDGPMEFVPLAVERQWAGAPLVPDEARAGQAWVETVANAIAKLTFGLRGGKPRVGLCLEAQLDAMGRGVTAVDGGARVDDFVEALEAALRGRNIDLAVPMGRALAPGHAWTLGEMRSALGGLAGVPDALVLVWDQDVSWCRVARGQVVESAPERRGGASDLGFVGLDLKLFELGATEKRLLVAARAGDDVASGLLREAAGQLGAEAANRLLDVPTATEGTHPNPAPTPDRILVTGRLGRLFSDTRLTPVLLDPFEVGLARGLFAREDAAQERGLLVSQGDGSGPTETQSPSTPGVLVAAPGLVQISQEESAAMIGAASVVALAPQSP